MVPLKSIRPDGAAAKLSLLITGCSALFALVVITACGGDGNNESPTKVDTGTPTDGPTATVPADARPANLLEDPTAFLEEFSDEILAERACEYNEANGVVDCREAGAGLIELVPGLPAGRDVECRVMLSGESPVGVRCKSEDPLFAAVYVLEE